MAAIVEHAVGVDHVAIELPALFYYSEDDQIVVPEKTAQVLADWGGPVTRATPELGHGVDTYAHVIAGDILSPANTRSATELILEWIRGF